MFTLAYLLASLFILGLLDVKGWTRVNSLAVYLLSLTSLILSAASGSYREILFGALPLLGMPSLYAVALSIIVLIALPGLGAGDKIFLSSIFFLYPFWFVWLVVALASMFVKPAFAILSIFIKGKRLSLPFYPFLFASALAVNYAGLGYAVALTAVLFAYLLFSRMRERAKSHRRGMGFLRGR
ncbi:MAG: hypothetical protein M1448_01195 [Candidatus Marsarchaeota archaeon]|jgi:hypothetical protein|nr:hypothetical protein [Candidatus Marsarchaeota archaeon]